MRYVLLAMTAAFVAACNTATNSNTATSGNAGAAATAAYQPRMREMTITAVPLLTKELVPTYPFLKQDFAKGGLLQDKEVYAFVPSTITVYTGDTIHFHLLNPEDDEHSFAVAGITVRMPPLSRTDTTLVAGPAGIYDIVCNIPAHMPGMWGQLIVLPAPPR